MKSPGYKNDKIITQNTRRLNNNNNNKTKEKRKRKKKKRHAGLFMKSPSSNGLCLGGIELRLSKKSSVSLALILTGSLSLLGTVDSLHDGNRSVERSVACERIQDCGCKPGPIDILGVC